MEIGMAGEVRFVLKGVDGATKQDTGFQKNLILNQGLDFFGGSQGTSIFAKCAIGSGNSAPQVTQNSLDALVKIVSGTRDSGKSDYVPGASNTYKVSATYKYSFTGLGAVNIAEVGLASKGTSATDLYLCTRALIKDALGAPTTISILAGETLEVYYKIWAVHSTLDINTPISMLDGSGGAVPYNSKVRLKDAGDVSNAPMVGVPVATNVPEYAFVGYAGEIGPLTGSPVGSHLGALGAIGTDETYVPGSHKRKGTYNLPLNNFNGNIRTVTVGTFMGQWQVRYGSVADDSPIPKTSKDTLALPFEFSWGRYEGAL